MSQPDTLNLWHEQQLVGQLWRNPVGAIGFRYDPAWVAGGGFAVSRSLPLAVGEFAPEAGISHRFFANLLPEAAVREHIVRDLKLPNTDFDATRLAPFYDLVCTRAIARIDVNLAFDVGGERNPSLISPSHWETLARQCDVRPQFLRRLVQQTAANLMGRLGQVREVFEADYGAYPALQRIEQVVTTQCRRITKR